MIGIIKLFRLTKIERKLKKQIGIISTFENKTKIDVDTAL